MNDINRGLTTSTTANAPVFPLGHRETYRLDELPMADVWANTAFPLFAKFPIGSVVVGPGAGNGRLAKNAPASRPWQELGVDNNAEAVAQYNAWAKENRRPDRARLGDFTSPTLVIPRDYLYAGAAASMFIHAVPRDKQEVAFENMHQLVVHDGIIVVTAPSFETSWRRIALGDQYVDGPNDVRGVMGVTNHPVPVMIDFFTRDRLASLAERHGIEVLDIIPTVEHMGWSACFGRAEDWSGLIGRNKKR